MNTDKQQLIAFLEQSNNIEGVFGLQPLKQALQAWQYLSRWDKLTKQNILKTHAILMKGLLDQQETGAWRRCTVWIGGQEAKPWYAVPSLMDFWIIIANSHLPLLKNYDENLFKDDHIAFEAIHPFIDGNGRMGRLILNWQRVKARLPILIIKEAEKFAYYEWFK